MFVWVVSQGKMEQFQGCAPSRRGIMGQELKRPVREVNEWIFFFPPEVNTQK